MMRRQIQLVDVIRFHSNVICSSHPWFSSNMPCKWSQRYHPKSKGDQFKYKLFGKGIVKCNAFKQNFTLFCSTSEPKCVSFTLWIFRWRIFDRRDVLYALGNDKVENDQLPEAVNVLYWFEKVPYLLCWELGRTLLFTLTSVCTYIFHTVHYTFPKMLIKRICLTVKSFFRLWPFSLFLILKWLIRMWYCKEKLKCYHSSVSKGWYDIQPYCLVGWIFIENLN